MTDDTRTPTTGAIARTADGSETGLVILGDCAEPDETTALVLPLTDETYSALYARLIAAWSNRADKYELASMALAVIGVETRTEARKTA